MQTCFRAIENTELNPNTTHTHTYTTNDNNSKACKNVCKCLFVCVYLCKATVNVGRVD